ncbi:hypothetical protein CEUSTIGMA_g7010.t1 [Chlamydomonas eustigma]|uniref:Uncharacterized protein n=1 Tax=Chlamydomonas eustigma TaxID=1157962 RepID=A0A250X9K5_9CHLO|nr:hypothetical protein CEUSTIGMA_g7010.t1 [Chlamydomonas eustigma]|eukprot:GAX79569.1 hypothetical protein CEUSTIGMA_g7010.t1 [Chlamydomonas eustigma]
MLGCWKGMEGVLEGNVGVLEGNGIGGIGVKCEGEEIGRRGGGGKVEREGTETGRRRAWESCRAERARRQPLNVGGRWGRVRGVSQVGSRVEMTPGDLPENCQEEKLSESFIEIEISDNVQDIHELRWYIRNKVQKLKAETQKDVRPPMMSRRSRARVANVIAIGESNAWMEAHGRNKKASALPDNVSEVVGKLYKHDLGKAHAPRNKVAQHKAAEKKQLEELLLKKINAEPKPKASSQQHALTPSKAIVSILLRVRRSKIINDVIAGGHKRTNWSTLNDNEDRLIEELHSIEEALKPQLKSANDMMLQSPEEAATSCASSPIQYAVTSSKSAPLPKVLIVEGGPVDSPLLPSIDANWLSDVEQDSSAAQSGGSTDFDSPVLNGLLQRASYLRKANQNGKQGTAVGVGASFNASTFKYRGSSMYGGGGRCPDVGLTSDLSLLQANASSYQVGSQLGPSQSLHLTTLPPLVKTDQRSASIKNNNDMQVSATSALLPAQLQQGAKADGFIEAEHLTEKLPILKHARSQLIQGHMNARRQKMVGVYGRLGPVVETSTKTVVMTRKSLSNLAGNTHEGEGKVVVTRDASWSQDYDTHIPLQSGTAPSITEEEGSDSTSPAIDSVLLLSEISDGSKEAGKKDRARSGRSAASGGLGEKTGNVGNLERRSLEPGCIKTSLLLKILHKDTLTASVPLHALESLDAPRPKRLLQKPGKDSSILKQSVDAPGAVDDSKHVPSYPKVASLDFQPPVATRLPAIAHEKVWVA